MIWFVVDGTGLDCSCFFVSEGSTYNSSDTKQLVRPCNSLYTINTSYLHHHYCNAPMSQEGIICVCLACCLYMSSDATPKASDHKRTCVYTLLLLRPSPLLVTHFC